MLLEKDLKELFEERQENRQYHLDQIKFWRESLSKSIEEAYFDLQNLEKHLSALKEISHEVA